MNLRTIPNKSNDIVWRVIDGEAVIITNDNRKMHTINAVGTRIWALLDGKRSLSDISCIISKEYDVEKDTIEIDLLELMENFNQMKLIEIEHSLSQ